MFLQKMFNCLFPHKWRIDEAQSAGSINTYQVCLKTGGRRVIPAPAACGYQPIDRAWLKGGTSANLYSPPKML